MYTTDVTVRVTTDLEIEPVAEWRYECNRGELTVRQNGNVEPLLCDVRNSPFLIVTPKEPAVSEPEVFTIPVEVPKQFYEKYASGKCGLSHCTAFNNSNGYRTALYLTPRTPRYEYPAELMSPEVWGIAVILTVYGSWNWCVYFNPPKPVGDGWGEADYIGWGTARLLMPGIGDPPTPEQCNNDWRQSCFKNPKWKGE